MSSALGRQQDSANLTTFRKVLSSSCLTLLLLISAFMLLNIIFGGKTFIWTTLF